MPYLLQQVRALLSSTQPVDATLTALAGLATAADRVPYFTGTDAAALAVLTAAGRALVDDADAAAQRTTLGLGALALLSSLATTALSDYTESTCTVTATGMTASVTGTARYVTQGKLVSLYVPQLSGTSNATTFTVTGLAAALTPTRDSYGYVFGADNGGNKRVLYYLAAGSTTLSLFVEENATPWTASGNKVLQPCWLTYALL